MSVDKIDALLFVATGTTEEAMARSRTSVRRQIAFYGSTPAYRAVLDLHGWRDLQPELDALSKSDRPDKWRELRRLASADERVRLSPEPIAYQPLVDASRRQSG